MAQPACQWEHGEGGRVKAGGRSRWRDGAQLICPFYSVGNSSLWNGVTDIQGGACLLKSFYKHLHSLSLTGGRKAFAVPIGLRHWGPRHSHAFVNDTYLLRTSSTSHTVGQLQELRSFTFAPTDGYLFSTAQRRRNNLQWGQHAYKLIPYDKSQMPLQECDFSYCSLLKSRLSVRMSCSLSILYLQHETAKRKKKQCF